MNSWGANRLMAEVGFAIVATCGVRACNPEPAEEGTLLISQGEANVQRSMKKEAPVFPHLDVER